MAYPSLNCGPWTGFVLSMAILTCNARKSFIISATLRARASLTVREVSKLITWTQWFGYKIKKRELTIVSHDKSRVPGG